MRVACILNHFNYFFPFRNQSEKHEYIYLTNRNRFRDLDLRKLFFYEYNNNNKNHQSPNIPIELYEHIHKLDSWQSNISLYDVVEHMYNFIKKILLDEKIELLISGATTVFERLTIFICKQENIKVLCVWEGFFRPNTISYDPKGMNAESEFSKVSWDEISKIKINKASTEFIMSYKKQIIKSGLDNSLRKIQAGKFNVLSQIKNRLKDRKDYERIKLPISTHINARINYHLTQKSYSTVESIKSDYIFFALQTHTDSNIIINSNITDYKNFVYDVIESFKIFSKNNNLKLLLKEHPLDVFRTSYKKENSENIVWLKPETSVNRIINNDKCLGVITVNSTAGFESLLLNKPVICFGKSMYSYDELIIKCYNHSDNEFQESFAKLLNAEVDMNKINQFAEVLYQETQFVGNLDGIPNKSEVNRFDEFITDYVNN